MKEIIGYILLGCIILFLLWMLFAQITGQKYKLKLFGTRRIPGSSSQIPLGGNVFGFYYVLREGLRFTLNRRKLDQRMISALFLKWMLEGRAVPQAGGGLIRSGSLGLNLDMGFKDRTEMALYEMALAASGRDYVLTTGEFKRWVQRYFRTVENWTDRARNRGRRYLISRGLMGEDNRGTAAGYDRLRGAIEFSNFLKKSSLSPRNLQAEPAQWTDYLVLATLCGAAGKVAEQLRRAFPKEFSQYSAAQARIAGSLEQALSLSNSMSRAYVRAAEQEDARTARRSR